LYPAYLRGEAFLLSNDGAAAVPEFKKILDHSGSVGNEPIGSLARFGMTPRGYAPSGDSANTKAAYDKFFELWKAADADTINSLSSRSNFPPPGPIW
jgi:eukaryotic-like serine/threonine-protein kinase